MNENGLLVVLSCSKFVIILFVFPRLLPSAIASQTALLHTIFTLRRSSTLSLSLTLYPASPIQRRQLKLMYAGTISKRKCEICCRSCGGAVVSHIYRASTLNFSNLAVGAGPTRVAAPRTRLPHHRQLLCVCVCVVLLRPKRKQK